MNYQAHLVGGVICGVGASYIASRLQVDHAVLYLVGGAIIGSLIPDIDHPKSFIGRKVPILPKLLYSHVGHRSLTHSFLFTLGFGLLLGLVNPSFGAGAAIGVLSHIALDMLTPAGVAFLYPFRKKRIKLF